MASTTAETTVNDCTSLYALCWAHTRDAIFAADCESGRFVDVNPAAESLTGYDRDELVGMHMAQLHPDAEQNRFREAFCAAGLEASELHGFHVERKGGGWIPVAISSSKSFESDGRRLLIGVLRDITELERNERVLSAKSWALSAYSSAALALGRARTSEGLMQTICDAITRESAYVLALVGIAEDKPGKPIRIAAAAGSAIDYLEGLSLSWSADDARGQGPAGICIRTNERQLIEDTATSMSYQLWRERARTVGIRSSAFIPFGQGSDWHGALMVYAANPYAFEADAVEVFDHLAQQIGHGLHVLEQESHLNAERTQREKSQAQLNEALSATVSAMAMALEKQDPYTAGHQARVAELATAIARQMGWSEDRLLGLRMAAMVHDIGKISIPRELLTKAPWLSAAERALIREHPETGYAILKEIPFHWPVAKIVLQHHEKLDGSGYPFGISGDAILLESRILAVADIVESMATDRPYRPALGIKVALQEIEEQAGKQLDADVVRTCVALFRENKFVLPVANQG